jgi:hypothetical protein
MTNWSGHASVDCPQGKDSIDDFFKEEISIIEDNDTHWMQLAFQR